MFAPFGPVSASDFIHLVTSNVAASSFTNGILFLSFSIVRVILEHCLSQTPWLVDEAQPDGLTALHLAALHGHLEVSDLLLQSGANPNCAVVNRPPGVLLASTSAPSSSRADGSMRPSACAVFTPLHLAVHKAHPDVVCLLLCYGARAAGRGSGNGDCRSPMQLALTTLAQTHDMQVSLLVCVCVGWCHLVMVIFCSVFLFSFVHQSPRRFDVALVPFLASVARLLIRMADSFSITPSGQSQLSVIGSTPNPAQGSDLDDEEGEDEATTARAQLTSISDTLEDTDRQYQEAGVMVGLGQSPGGRVPCSSSSMVRLVSPSPLCRRLKSTIQATLETGVPRLVLIAACLASAIGAESWSPNCTNEREEMQSAEMLTENFVTDIFTECLDPVLQLALQQCHMEAMNSVSQIRSHSTGFGQHDCSRSPRHGATQSRSDLLVDVGDSEEENLVDILFHSDEPSHSTVGLLPNPVSTIHEESFLLDPVAVNQADEGLIQPITIANQLIPTMNNATCYRGEQVRSYRLLPPSLNEIDLEWRECLVCSENDRTTILSPCGHIITCTNCTSLIKKCLLCRQRVNGFHELSNCCECNQTIGVILARPCNHVLWCKACLKSKVSQLEAAAENLDPLSGFNLTTENSSGTNLYSPGSSMIQEGDHGETGHQFITAGTETMNEWREVPLSRLLTMVNTLSRLLEDLLSGGLCIDGCPVCGTRVETLWPIIVSCAGVEHRADTITGQSSVSVQSHLPRGNVAGANREVQTTVTLSAAASTPSASIFNAGQSTANFVPNQLCPQNSNLSVGRRNLELNSPISRQPITPNNRLTGRSETVSIRQRQAKMQLCDRELSKLKHELQVMREQIRCPICLDRSRNLVFMCGHATCQWCGDQVTACPICRRAVESRIILY
ncbi:hypothetical protein P879_01488 [Paragonimus westermani]|uniref:RING-type domain-containing protein n=1 Tax=Paragonimus westermani TaxID=34504 RepID=A0A8T0DR37_9TREM|nr:hypothetical protein P879_01488 [Paragonimus westermani]